MKKVLTGMFGVVVLLLNVVLQTGVVIAEQAQEELKAVTIGKSIPEEEVMITQEHTNESSYEEQGKMAVSVDEEKYTESVTSDTREVIEMNQESSHVEVPQTQSLKISVWGTAPVSFDDVAGVLTVSAGMIQNNGSLGFVDNDNAIKKADIKEIKFEPGVIAPENSSYLFSNSSASGTNYYPKLEKVSGELDTSQVIDMSGMFSGSPITYLDVSSWDTSNVVDMSYMFSSLTNLSALNVSQWDTGHVTSMYGMFFGSINLNDLDVSEWDTGQVINMGAMFNRDSLNELSSIDVSNWDTSQVKYASRMFYGYNVSALDVSEWDTRNIEDMSYMFYATSSLTSLDVSGWDTSNVTDMNNMFGYTDSLSRLDIGNWDTNKVTNMNHMFVSAKSLKSLELSRWDIRKVTNMGGMFASASSLESLDVSGWDTTHMPFMNALFAGTRLTRLTVGEKSLFNRLVNLPAISTSTGEYTGAWERIVPELPAQVYSSSRDFMERYDGSMPGSYVWQEVEDLTSIVGKDSTIYLGTLWSPTDNFVSATDKNGNRIEFSEVTVSGEVNTATPGNYEVTYSYGGQSTTITVTVMQDQTTIVVKDTTIYVGTSWSAAMNFVSATGEDGTIIDLSQVVVSGSVNKAAPGIYEIAYSYGGITRTATITVLADQTSIQGKDSRIYTSTPWSPEDNFMSATDKDGNAVGFSGVMVIGTVNTHVPGDYDITYNHTDIVTGKEVTATVTVTVLKDQSTLAVKDTTIYVGTPWTAADNFVSATDKEGKSIDFSQLLISGSVDIMTPGRYVVDYMYLPNTRTEEGSLTETAIITVLEKEPVTPPIPVDPATPVAPTKPVVSTNSESTKPAETIQSIRTLPKAGEQRLEATLLSWLGIVVVTGAAWFIGLGSYRRQK